MRIGFYGHGRAPAGAYSEMLWDCLRGLGESVLRLEAEPAMLARGLARVPRLEMRAGNRLVTSVTTYCPRESGLDEEGAWLYGGEQALYFARTPELLLAPVVPLRDGIPAWSLLLFNGAGELSQALQPADTTAARELDTRIGAWLHPRQDCLPTLETAGGSSRPPRSAELGELERHWCRSITEAEFVTALCCRGLERSAVYRRIGDHYAMRVAAETLPSALALAEARTEPLAVTQVNGDTRNYCRAVPHARGWRGAELAFSLGPCRQQWACNRLGEVWRVRRPGLDGIETTLEVLDDRGELALILGSDDEPAWRRLLGDALYPPACGQGARVEARGASHWFRA